MALSDSALQPEALAYARGLLKPRAPRDSTWPAIGAAFLWAVAALGLAFAMLTSPAPGMARAPEPSSARAPINP